MTGEDILGTALTEVHDEVAPDQAIDLVAISQIINLIFDTINRCQSGPLGVKRQVARGGSIVRGRLRKVLKKRGYSSKQRRDMAEKLAKRGANLTEDEVDKIIQDSGDMPPAPPPGPWPFALLLLPLFLIPASVEASPWPDVDTVAVVSTSAWPELDKPEVVVDEPAYHVVMRSIPGCGPCNHDKKHLIPALEKYGIQKGRDIQIVTGGAQSYPTYELYEGDEKMDTHVGSMTVDQYAGFIRPLQAKYLPHTVKDADTESGVSSNWTPPSRYRRWTYSGSNLAGHCMSHGYTRAEVQGKTRAQLIYMHSYAHNNPGRLYRPTVQYAARRRRATQTASAAYCPTCPR